MVNRQRDYIEDGLALGGIALAGAGFYLLSLPLLLVFLGLILLAVAAYRSR